MRDHHLWADGADDAADVVAELHRHLDAAVDVTEEVEGGDTDLGSRLRLFLTADRSHLGARDRTIETARLTVGDEAVDDLDPGVGEQRHGAGRREVDVVRMRHDHENPFDFRRLQHGDQSTASSRRTQPSSPTPLSRAR